MTKDDAAGSEENKQSEQKDAIAAALKQIDSYKAIQKVTNFMWDVMRVSSGFEIVIDANTDIGKVAWLLHELTRQDNLDAYLNATKA